MIFIDWVFIAIFSLFIAPRGTRVTAFVLLFGYAFYGLLAFKFNGLDRYGFIAVINLLSGLYLTYFHRDLLVAILFYTAIPVGFIGGVLYENYYPAYYYDNMCVSIMVLQVLSLTYRVIVNGINTRNDNFYSVHVYYDNDSNKGLFKMLKNKSQKEADRCAKK